jgi:hypothetical protein
MGTDTSTPSLPWISEKDYISISIPPAEMLKPEKEKDEQNNYDYKEEPLSDSQGYGNFITYGTKPSMEIPPRSEEDSWSSIIGFRCFSAIFVIILFVVLWFQPLYVLSKYTGTSGDQLFTIILGVSVVVGPLFTLLARRKYINGRRTARDTKPFNMMGMKSTSTEILLEHAITNLRQPPRFKWHTIKNTYVCECFAYSLANPYHSGASKFSQSTILFESLFNYLSCLIVITSLGSLYLGVFIQLLIGQLDEIWTFVTWDILYIILISAGIFSLYTMLQEMRQHGWMAEMADFSSELRKDCLEAEEEVRKRENIEICIRAIFYEENSPEDTKKAWEKFIKPILDAIVL